MTRPNGDAPAVQGFAFGPRMAKAWQLAWDKLSRQEWTQGQELAEEIAKLAEVQPVSVLTHLHRMRKAGYLEHELRSVSTEVTRDFAGKSENDPVREVTFSSNRRRTFFRIASHDE